MSINPLDALFQAGMEIIKRIWPDPVRQAEEARKLQELYQKGDLAELQAHVELVKGQLAVNAKEAEHKSIFVAGWRPFIGWVGGAALAYQFVLYPFLIWIWVFLQANGTVPMDLAPPPVLETGALFSIITGMLGVAGMRSYEKTKGVSRETMSNK